MYMYITYHYIFPLPRLEQFMMYIFQEYCQEIDDYPYEYVERCSMPEADEHEAQKHGEHLLREANLAAS